MASIILAAVGGSSALGLGVGGQVAGVIAGTLIDQYWTYPTFFPPEEPDLPAPRTDLQFAMGREGSIGKYPIGKYARVPCFPIWAGPLDIRNEPNLIVEAIRPNGPDSPRVQYFYVHLGYLAAVDVEIESFERVWMDGELVYTTDTDPERTSTLITASLETIPSLYRINTPNDDPTAPGPSTVTTDLLVLTSPSNGPDLTRFSPNVLTTVSGFTEAGNNETFMCLDVRRNWPAGETNTVLILGPTRYEPARIEAPDGVGYTLDWDDLTFYVDDGSVYAPAAEAAGDSVTISQADIDLPQDIADDFRFYTGTNSQNVDTLISSQNAGAPGFRGSPYFVVEKLALRRFGNRPPRQVEALVKVQTTYTVGDAISEIVTKFSSLTADDIDVSTLTDSFEGGMFNSPSSPKTALNTIMMTYNVIDQEVNGRIVFKKRDDYTPVTVTTEKIRAHEEGDDAPRPFEESRLPRTSLPQRITVSYIDSSIQYQQASRTAKTRQVDGGDTIAFDLPLTLTADKAMETANRKIWSDRVARIRVRGTLPPSLQYVTTNDVLSVDLNGLVSEIRVRSISEGANGLLEFEGILESRAGQEQSGESDVYLISGETPAFSNFVQFMPIDIPPLRDEQATRKGFYFSALSTAESVGWQGATLYESQLEDDEFSAVASVETEGRRGYTVSTSSLSTTAQAQWWDEASHVDVRLLNSTPDKIPGNATRSEVLNGKNWILVGGEILGYRTATLQSGGEWRLSGLLRGLRCTDNFIGDHDLGTTPEAVVFLDSEEIEFRDLDQSEIGSSFYYRAVPPMVSLGAVTSVSYTLLGRSVKPFSPIFIRRKLRTAAEASAINTAHPNMPIAAAENDLVYEFTRRTRLQHRLFGPVDAPQDETGDAGPFYVAYVFNTSGTFLRLLTNDHEDLSATGRISTPGLERIVYPRSQQNSDGLSVDGQVKMYIAQFKDVGGPGFLSPTQQL